MLDMSDAHQMLRSGRSADVHIEIEECLPTASEPDRVALAHIRTAAFVHERRFTEAFDHLDQSKSCYGCETLVHQSRAMIFEILGNDACALRELETAPYDREIQKFRLLADDAYFYRAYFEIKRGIPIDIEEIDARYPVDFGTYLPHLGRMRGVHISKGDLIALNKKVSERTIG